MKTKIEIGNLSDIGKVRNVNEDYFGSYNGKYGNLVIVCDGMGGHKGGAVASRLAVETIKAHFDVISDKFNAKEQLNLALVKADNVIKEKAIEDPELKEMGSTVVVMLFKADQVYYAHIGDSRIYMIRNDSIHQLTKDHSLVQQMVDANIITAEAAKDHPKKNVITHSLGADGSSEPEIAEPLSIFKKDKFILCSDGLTGYVNEVEILQIVSKNSLHEACQKLVDLANSRGGKDNITVQIVSVVSGKRLPVSRNLMKEKIQLIGALVLLLIAIYIGYLTFGKMLFETDDVKPTKKVEKSTRQNKSEDMSNPLDNAKTENANTKIITDTIGSINDKKLENGRVKNSTESKK